MCAIDTDRFCTFRCGIDAFIDITNHIIKGAIVSDNPAVITTVQMCAIGTDGFRTFRCGFSAFVDVANHVTIGAIDFDGAAVMAFLKYCRGFACVLCAQRGDACRTFANQTLIPAVSLANPAFGTFEQHIVPADIFGAFDRRFDTAVF